MLIPKTNIKQIEGKLQQVKQEVSGIKGANEPNINDVVKLLSVIIDQQELLLNFLKARNIETRFSRELVHNRLKMCNN